ncbi:MAG TPA: LysR family transcriptional regulator [Candidatus Aphodovivens avistercoris]|nr:LysR family transcriptional regulator [Candidatus Aphodovivens avistercoris]
MDLNELEAVAAVHLYSSYAHAAKGTGLPVSTLSKRVSRVEDELGVRLFNRSPANAPVTLTEAGELLVPLVHKLLNTNRFMRNHVEGIRGDGASSIVVGSTTTLVDKGDGRIIADFMHERPDVELVSVVRSQNEVTRFLAEARIDCAFLVMTGAEGELTDLWETFSGGRFESLTLRASSHMFIAMSERDPLAARSEVRLSDLKRRRFIFNEWDNADSPQRRRVGFFKTLGVNQDDFDVSFENFINRSYVLDLVRLGVGILPQVFPLEQETPGVKYVRLADWSQPTSIIFVVRKYRTGALADFAQHVANFVAAREAKGASRRAEDGPADTAS